MNNPLVRNFFTAAAKDLKLNFEWHEGKREAGMTYIDLKIRNSTSYCCALEFKVYETLDAKKPVSLVKKTKKRKNANEEEEEEVEDFGLRGPASGGLGQLIVEALKKLPNVGRIQFEKADLCRKLVHVPFTVHSVILNQSCLSNLLLKLMQTKLCLKSISVRYSP